jgi:hypothetical protein
MKSAQPWLLGGALAAGLVTTLAHPGAARACGGLFCSAAMPVNQAAERIIFSFDQANKKVTAVVEILYQGPSEKFAWVLPVPGIPKVGVSTSTLLDRLQSITNPTYNIQRTWSSMCGGTGGAGGSGGSSAGGVPGAADGGLSGPPGVSVLSAGSVGPYDYQLLKVDPALTDPAMVAIDWLKANGYDVGALGPDVLRPYLRDNLNLLAFKLTKKASTGSIRPIMISYDSEHPMIPIRPTAVAANDDMGILVWVLGSNRAVTTNYKTLELNEAMLDWFNPSTTYKDVVTAAADEAEGQGFVTEMAGPTATRNIAGSIYNEQFTVDEFRRTADRLDVPDLVVKAVDSFTVFSGGGGLPGLPGGPVGRVALDGVTDVLAKHLTLPTGVTVADVLASPRCYFAK